jgi:hypothetical protein
LQTGGSSAYSRMPQAALQAGGHRFDPGWLESSDRGAGCEALRVRAVNASPVQRDPARGSGAHHGGGQFSG